VAFAKEALLFRPTIRNLLLVAFGAIAAIVALTGGYGVRTITESGTLVVQTFDRPLMTISHAWAAQAGFLALEGRLAGADGADAETRNAEMDERLADIIADLEIARQRATSGETAGIVDEVEAAMARWAAIRRTLDGAVAANPDLAAAHKAVLERLDVLIETTAGDGFLHRQRALAAIEENRDLAIGGVAIAILLTVLVTFLLGRRIVRPIHAALLVANRISGGDLMVAMPRASNDETGQLLAAMQVMQDNLRTTMDSEIKQRQWAQMSLVDAIERSPQAVFLLDARGRIVIANGQAHGYFPELTPAMTPDSPFDDFLDLTQTGGVFEPMGANDETGLPGEVRLASGAWLRVTRSPTRDGGALVFWHDVTDLRDREEALVRAKEKAEAANAAKSSFLTAMSHELRTPLNAVIGFSDMIANERLGPVGKVQYKDYAGDIQRSGEHLLGIINDILNLAKFDAGKMQLNRETVAIASLFDDCRVIIGEQCIRRGLTFNMTPPGDALELDADPVKVRQILINLLSNAVKFTPAGGTVTLVGRETADGVELVVTDTGIGMKEEDIPTALAPFGQIDSRLARAYEGTGLGLPLTKALVELHDGTLRIASRPGEGTTVTVNLPRPPAEAPVEAPVAHSEAA
jgi:signal transduction histidine kinase